MFIWIMFAGYNLLYNIQPECMLTMFLQYILEVPQPHDGHDTCNIYASAYFCICPAFSDDKILNMQSHTEKKARNMAQWNKRIVS